MLNKQVGI